MVAGIEQSSTLFHTVFFAVILSVLVQGPTISLAARWLGVAQAPVDIDPDPIELVGPVELGLSLTRLEVQETSQAEGKKLLEVGGPGRPLVVLMRREGRVYVPHGGSTLRAGDELFVLGGDDSVAGMREVLAASPSGVAATENG
jgi:cell volume regulation protein A